MYVIIGKTQHDTQTLMNESFYVLTEVQSLVGCSQVIQMSADIPKQQQYKTKTNGAWEIFSALKISHNTRANIIIVCIKERTLLPARIKNKKEWGRGPVRCRR